MLEGFKPHAGWPGGSIVARIPAAALTAAPDLCSPSNPQTLVFTDVVATADGAEVADRTPATGGRIGAQRAFFAASLGAVMIQSRGGQRQPTSGCCVGIGGKLRSEGEVRGAARSC